MLKQLVEHLNIDEVDTVSDSDIHLSFDEATDVTCSETSRYIRFESVVAILPTDEIAREELLNQLLTRAFKMTRIRHEGIYVDSDSATVRLQLHIDSAQSCVLEVARQLNEFLTGLAAWKKLAVAPTKTSLNSIDELMRMHS